MRTTLTARVYDRDMREHVTKTFTLEIDEAGLARCLAQAAYDNKTKRTVLRGGAIVLTLVRP